MAHSSIEQAEPGRVRSRPSNPTKINQNTGDGENINKPTKTVEQSVMDSLFITVRYSSSSNIFGAYRDEGVSCETYCSSNFFNKMLVNCIEQLVKSIQIERDARRDNTKADTGS